MTVEMQSLLTYALPIAAFGVWLIRLEGRINMNEKLTSDLTEDVKYIRDRIDRAINGNGPTINKRATD
jgi:sensor domain CHASE-containing protein